MQRRGASNAAPSSGSSDDDDRKKLRSPGSGGSLTLVIVLLAFLVVGINFLSKLPHDVQSAGATPQTDEILAGEVKVVDEPTDDDTKKIEVFDESSSSTDKAAAPPPVVVIDPKATSTAGIIPVSNKTVPTGADAEYHVIFSTGCSIYQDWQSYVFFYFAMKSKQPGTITRIVSGCNDGDEAKLRHVFEEQIQPMSTHFKIHFTPDYSKLKPGKNFPYFNKPFGTKHWLENVMGYPNHPVNDEAIVILMDPDQIILRPFRNNDFSNTNWRFAKQDKARTTIQHGYPMGQLYGFGLQWRNKVKMEDIAPYDLPSPVDQLTGQQARDGFIAGPPYIATARDMYRISSTWSAFVERVHDSYPHLLAEMFAYCLAAAHLRMPHQIAASFMISDPGAGKGEGWPYISKIPERDICKDQPEDLLPNVIHFCQRYALGKYFFAKRRLPKTFLTCEGPLLAEPPHDILVTHKSGFFPGGGEKQFDDKRARAHGFMICHLLAALNEAATYFKQKHCDQATANYNKNAVFISGFPSNYTFYKK